ncbi:MAG: aminoglycoside phosphotransferase family protein [Pseudomonadota bacterium]|jgi:aminoglycoside/choline kinase family phosphotransferase
MSSLRMTALTRWVAQQHGLDMDEINLQEAGGDASFRHYYRLTLPDGSTRMVMDAPPEQEDSTPFVNIAQQWQAGGLPVPHIFASNLEEGFLLLEDLGDTPLQHCFNDPASVHQHTLDALVLIGELQNRASPEPLPRYDSELLGRELDLFPTWCLEQWLAIPAPDEWPSLRNALIEQALAQPFVSVHRDFDAMNLMVHREKLYMIDFQDAVAGPLSYDVISLLRGRYWRLNAEEFADAVQRFYQRARQDGRLTSRIDETTFLGQCQAMAAQRSLKVLGIFCRLTLRDHKPGYLARLPHFLDHLQDSLVALPEHADFALWVSEQLRPAILQRCAEAASPEST